MVASYTQLLSRRYKGQLDADADEFIAFAVDGASRMQRLIEDLLSYSRVVTKGTELSATSSENALNQALLNLRLALAESGAEVTHDTLPIVMADEMQLVQLFQNLIGNAIKFRSPERTPVINITSQIIPRVQSLLSDSGKSQQEEVCQIIIEDNGIGFDEKYRTLIFQMFQRLHTRSEFEGTGIGLALCKRIVEYHRGTITATSEPRVGSRFIITFPKNGLPLNSGLPS